MTDRAELDQQLRDAETAMIAARVAYRRLKGEDFRARAAADPLLLIGRKRHRRFAESVVKKLAAGAPLKDAAKSAVAVTFPLLHSDEAIARKARSLLGNPDIADAMATLYARGGLPLEAAIRLHVEHILGTVPRGDDGPNYLALRDYFRLSLGEFIDRDPSNAATMHPTREPGRYP